MAKKEYFHIEVGDQASLSIDEIWPDGDAPENPTVDDVIAVIKSVSMSHTFDVDWGFDIQTYVDGKLVDW